ncbi:MAG: transcription termination factor Rho [Gemmatimonadales bacterium]|nr:transcription termination factor Rho [Gemmatimonadales bacterium]
MIEGILDLAGRNGGFLRRRDNAYQPDQRDLAVPANLISQFRLRPGDEIVAEPKPGGRPTIGRITSVNGRPLEAMRDRPEYDRLTAIHPNEALRLECPLVRRGQPDATNRVIDLLCPFGKGQRALIVAPAKAGKTMVLQAIAEGITVNHPEVRLYILLVDERPEEVFEIEAAGFGEVIASTFDHPPARHVACAELLLERARRRVELGEDVVLIVDSLTRLARAYNAVVKGSGRTLSGGVGAESLERPKRFFGSARKVDPRAGGGSLTIIATALIDTGSKMDQLIYEEFKGTGNSELVLNRELADRRIFPAIDLVASGTRKEELLLSPEGLAAAQQLRRQIDRMPPASAMEIVLGLMRRHSDNKSVAQSVRIPSSR